MEFRPQVVATPVGGGDWCIEGQRSSQWVEVRFDDGAGVMTRLEAVYCQ